MTHKSVSVQVMILILMCVCLCTLAGIVWYVHDISENLDYRLMVLEQTISHAEMKMQKVASVSTSDTVESLANQLAIHNKENADLKQRTLRMSPDGKRTAFYQNKFVTDMSQLGDRDYTSLIVTSGDTSDVIFQGTFKLSGFEWLTNNTIEVGNNCGTGCMQKYAVNIFTKKYTESVVSAFDVFIDITELSPDDYSFITERKNSSFFFQRDEYPQLIQYNSLPVKSLALSPSRQHVAFVYLPNKNNSNEGALAVLDLSSTAVREVYWTSHLSENITSSVDWVGDTHLLFTRSCGNACLGLTLLTLPSGERAQATVVSSSLSDQPPTSIFTDWSGQKHTLEGIVRRVKSENGNDHASVIFELADSQKNFLGETKLEVF